MACLAVVVGAHRLAFAQQGDCQGTIVYDTATGKYHKLGGCPETCTPDSGVCRTGVQGYGGVNYDMCGCFMGTYPPVTWTPAYSTPCAKGFHPDVPGGSVGTCACVPWHCTATCYRTFSPFEPLEEDEIWPPVPPPPLGDPPPYGPNTPDVLKVDCICQ